MYNACLWSRICKNSCLNYCNNTRKPVTRNLKLPAIRFETPDSIVHFFQRNPDWLIRDGLYSPLSSPLAFFPLCSLSSFSSETAPLLIPLMTFHISELKEATYRSHRRRPELNISHARTVVSPRF